MWLIFCNHEPKKIFFFFCFLLTFIEYAEYFPYMTVFFFNLDINNHSQKYLYFWIGLLLYLKNINIDINKNKYFFCKYLYYFFFFFEAIISSGFSLLITKVKFNHFLCGIIDLEHNFFFYNIVSLSWVIRHFFINWKYFYNSFI